MFVVFNNFQTTDILEYIKPSTYGDLYDSRNDTYRFNMLLHSILEHEMLVGDAVYNNRTEFFRNNTAYEYRKQPTTGSNKMLPRDYDKFKTSYIYVNDVERDYNNGRYENFPKDEKIYPQLINVCFFDNNKNLVFVTRAYLNRVTEKEHIVVEGIFTLYMLFKHPDNETYSKFMASSYKILSSEYSVGSWNDNDTIENLKIFVNISKPQSAYTYNIIKPNEYDDESEALEIYFKEKVDKTNITGNLLLVVYHYEIPIIVINKNTKQVFETPYTLILQQKRNIKKKCALIVEDYMKSKNSQ